jgi:hypothetical protein
LYLFFSVPSASLTPPVCTPPVTPIPFYKIDHLKTNGNGTVIHYVLFQVKATATATT